MQKHRLFLVERDAALIDDKKIALPHERFRDGDNLLVSGERSLTGKLGSTSTPSSFRTSRALRRISLLSRVLNVAVNFAAEEDVLLDRHRRRDPPLMNDGNSSATRRCWREIRDLDPVQFHRARSRPYVAGDDLRERRFSGAVLTHQSSDLTRRNRDADRRRARAYFRSASRRSQVRDGRPRAGGLLGSIEPEGGIATIAQRSALRSAASARLVMAVHPRRLAINDRRQTPGVMTHAAYDLVFWRS